MNDFTNFSSLPVEQERSFVVFEQRMAEAQKTGWTFALIASAVFLVFALAIYLGVTPDQTDITKDMNMSNLAKTPGAK